MVRLPHASLGAALLIGLLLLSACGDRPAESPADGVRDMLAGRWLREYHQEGAGVQRVLTMERDGRFFETARVFHADGAVTEHAHEGKWFFDGTNLKRRYTLFDGRQPSAPQLPYVTHQLSIASRHEFTGTDNLRRRQVRYQRVREGAGLARLVHHGQPASLATPHSPAGESALPHNPVR